MMALMVAVASFWFCIAELGGNEFFEPAAKLLVYFPDELHFR